MYKAEAEKAIEEERVKESKRKQLAIKNREAVSGQIESKVTKKLHPILLSDIENTEKIFSRG